DERVVENLDGADRRADFNGLRAGGVEVNETVAVNLPATRAAALLKEDAFAAAATLRPLAEQRMPHDAVGRIPDDDAVGVPRARVYCVDVIHLDVFEGWGGLHAHDLNGRLPVEDFAMADEPPAAAGERRE